MAFMSANISSNAVTTKCSIDDEPDPDRVGIAFMGITGSGKSSFIKALTGRSDIAVGHSLEACKPWPTKTVRLRVSLIRCKALRVYHRTM